MKKHTAPIDADEYVNSISGWQREPVAELRRIARAEPALEEVVKWGHLVYVVNGPAFLIRAEEDRVLFGFWRGKRLQHIEPGLRASGKYEMATLELRETSQVDLATARQLIQAAIELNTNLGDPTKVKI